MEGIHCTEGNPRAATAIPAAGPLRLIAGDGRLEVMLCDLPPGAPCFVTPGSTPDALEVYYLLDGDLVLRMGEDETVLYPGGHFHTRGLSADIPLETRSGARLLMVSEGASFDRMNRCSAELWDLLRRAEDKDLHTHAHGIRVQSCALRICRRMGRTGEFGVSLGIAALFHDVGKCVIPDRILKKPGRLDPEEAAVVRMHPGESCRMLAGGFPDRIPRIAGQHHERLDGSGYPDHLSGDDILPEARILAVADAYDAMTSDRSYRRALPPVAALAELRAGAGRAYDPAVVAALEEMLEDEGILEDPHRIDPASRGRFASPAGIR